jgi:hypothetical protein
MIPALKSKLDLRPTVTSTASHCDQRQLPSDETTWINDEWKAHPGCSSIEIMGLGHGVRHKKTRIRKPDAGSMSNGS